MDIESEIGAIPTIHKIGPLSLNTSNLKLQLGSESRQWKIQYSNKVFAGKLRVVPTLKRRHKASQAHHRAPNRKHRVWLLVCPLRLDYGPHASKNALCEILRDLHPTHSRRALAE